MLAEERNRRQIGLEKTILELSVGLLEDSDIRKISLKLLDIYRGDFRHGYSGFFPLIFEISKDDNNYDLEYLSNNLETIRDYIERDFVSGTQEFSEIQDQVFKLCDHLNLEIGRWSYYAQNDQRIEGALANTIKLNDELGAARSELEKASAQASSMQTEVIAVLSIFAGIVFAFAGGFTYLGSVMTSIKDVQHYEAVVLMAIICGMIVFNTLFLLMYLVGKITKRNIYAKCKSEECSCNPACYGLIKIKKRLPYVFYFNLLCMLGIIVDCAVWYCDIRNWFYL